MTGRRRHDLVGMSGRVGALAPARHARRVRLPEAFFPPGERGLFSTVRSKTLKKKSTGPQLDIGLEHKSDNFSIQCSLGSPKNRRMRSRGSPDLRPIPERVRESIYVRKKYVIWTRWRPVPVKNVNYPRPPRNRTSGLVGPHTTPAIVNYKYMDSTPREGYFGPTTLGT